MPEIKVILFRDEDWESMPDAVRRRIEAGVERIRSQMTWIAERARVRTMPRIIVQPCVWHHRGQIVDATLCTLASTPGHPELGVVVSATVALCEDEAVVKDVLMHEIGHCFETARKLVDQVDLGLSAADLRGDPTDEARDRRMLPVMANWFVGPVGAFMQWGDEPIVPNAEIQGLLDAGHLSLSASPLMSPGMPSIPADWTDHIRSLRSG
jgi:hypothetical protein